MTSTTVFVSCDGIKLKLTCTPELLKKPFEECLVAPFLGAFNKKRGTSFTPAQLPKVEIEGQLVKDIGLSGAHVLVSSAPMAASPNVVLFLPSNAAGTSSACAAAVEQLLLLDPTGSDDGVPARAALKALRTAVKEAPMAAEPAVNPKIISLLAAYCCLLDDERAWSAASGEAAVALSNLLVVSKEKAGTLLCAAELGALPRLISNFDCNEPSKRLPLPRLRILAPIVFHLSLHQGIKTHSDAFFSAVRSALLYTAECLALPNLVDASGPTAAPLAADLTRTTFNLLRAYPPNPKTDSGQLAINELLDAVASLFSVHEMNSNTTSSSAAAAEAPPESLAEAQRAALQIPVALPDDDQNYQRLCKCWEVRKHTASKQHAAFLLTTPFLSLPCQGIFHLLPPLLIAAEATPSEDASNACVLPLLTLQRLVEVDKETRDAFKLKVFGEVIEMQPGPDPYQPLGCLGWDPNVPLGPSGHIRLHLIKMLTSSAAMAKHVCGNLLFAVCEENPKMFVHLCGLGSAAGLLTERGLFGEFQQQVEAQQGSDAARIEEMDVN